MHYMDNINLTDENEIIIIFNWFCYCCLNMLSVVLL